MKKLLPTKVFKREKIFLLFIMMSLLIGSCKKNNKQIVMDNALSINDAKLLYDAQYMADNIGNKGIHLEPLWDKAIELSRLDSGIVLKFPMTQSNNPYILSTVIFKKNSSGSYDVKINEISVDSNYLNRFKNEDINSLTNRLDFSGKIYTKTLANRIEKISAYAKGSLMYEGTYSTIKNRDGARQLGGNGKMMSVADGSGSYQIVNYNIQLRSVPMNMLICTRSVSFTIYPGSSPMYAEVLSKVKQTCSTTQATNSPDVAYQIFIELWGIAQNLAAQNNPTDEEEPSSGGSGNGTVDPRYTEEMQAFESDYKSRMSSEELTIYNGMNFGQRLDYLTAAYMAEQEAISRFPTMDQGDTKADAFRHAFFNILNVLWLGNTLAESLGNAHEVKQSNGLYSLSSTMDLYNNAIGRGAFTSLPSGTNVKNYYSGIVYNLLTNGNLVYLKNGTITSSNQ